MSKLMLTYEEWVRQRKHVISTLRELADRLEWSHRRNANKEEKCAAANVIAGGVGLLGIFLAPVSGGLSLLATAASAGTSIGTFAVKYDANSEDERITKDVFRKVEASMNDDRIATENLQHVMVRLDVLEKKLFEMEIDEILLKVQETSYIRIQQDYKVSRRIVHDKFFSADSVRGQGDRIHGLGIAQQAANLNAALTSTKRVIHLTQTTIQNISQTRSITQIISTARSVNDVSKAATQLSAASLAVQASQSAIQSTKAFAAVARSSDSVIKIAGVASSSIQTSKLAAQLTTNSGQVASLARSVSQAAKAAETVSIARKGKDTIQTIRSMNQVSKTAKMVTTVAIDSNKLLRTTHITRNATRVSKISQTATKAASISKIGIAVNAIVIPIDIYVFVKASENTNKSHEDVENIRKMANGLEKELNENAVTLRHQWSCFHELHTELTRVYKEHNIYEILKFLYEMHWELDFSMPVC